jgi:TATA-box binding protein (TBP) (component of TFIID and TFIIIB)
METLVCGSCGAPTFLCKCNVSWKTFNEIINVNCRGDTQNGVVYTPLSISTMTICFNFNQFVNLQLLKDNLPDYLKVTYRPGSRKSKEKKTKGTDSFYNSFDVKLCFADRLANPVVFSNVSIFIFPNGKAKIAGVRTTNTINVVINELIEIINSVPEVIKDPKTFAAENIKVQMICSDFVIKPVKENPYGWCLRQEDLKNLLVKNKFSATFSSMSRYPGINLKIPSVIETGKEVSLLIFRSGSIIITGVKHAEDVYKAYDFIVNIIIENKETLFYYDINEEIKQMKKKKK